MTSVTNPSSSSADTVVPRELDSESRRLTARSRRRRDLDALLAAIDDAVGTGPWGGPYDNATAHRLSRD